ncbi:alpha/beta fold hydrolase [Companilactobacillus baiquanensis]|uniref:Alpha/beta fold hydrolase n=1 Tax=Companilactobacillus baiquanensis TaxID=2486005 RepID=A0ABW1UVK1_9LACO|nr:alpha/beta hydrolase [Companilactobacillus baiquanensis]
MKIAINNTELSYEIVGTGFPVYFFHGMSQDSTGMIENYEPVMSMGIKRIYLDLPGMGNSQDISSVHNSDDVLNLVIEFIEQITGDQKIAICGHSYGGYICLGLLKELGSKIKAAFITCPVIHANKENRDISKHKNIIQEELNTDDPNYQKFLKMDVLINQKSWQNYQRAILPGLKKYNIEFWNQIKASHNYSFSFEKELVADLAHNKTDVMILLGKNDQIVGYRDQLTLLDPDNEIQISVLNDSGHNLFTDKNQYFEESFKKFSKSIKKI